MFGTATRKTPQTIGFLLLPQFSMIAFTASIEPLRAANRISRKSLYEWKTASIDGGPVSASNGVTITPDLALKDAKDCDVIFVCAGLRPHQNVPQNLGGTLRDFARKGLPLGSVCTGSVALAIAGLLKGYRCTIHWQNIEGFAESFPALDITATLFEIDRNRYTCSGGTAPLDMMIHSIKLDHGDTLALSVAEQMLHNFVREPQAGQRMAIEHRTGIRHPKLLAAIAYMEAHIENPISLQSLCTEIGLSLRQLERLFKSQIDTTPARYYLDLRIRRARQLLRQSPMSIMEIAVATGFNSASHFTQVYKKTMGYAPSEERKL